ncbi:SRPBCC domain-containing protein [Nordella sp. HKS 07]|uniref:SRPBCC domain-containing protein n=1 Tax=Nordella sp. HKS 07 TaxID=2712222 RepID=UPI001FEEA75B|nr:SRPBCC domain-containing protein [Nordella sp. HKS 07]
MRRERAAERRDLALTATPTGTRLRMEQSGFAPDQPAYFYGARMGWPQFMAKLEQLLTGLD